MNFLPVIEHELRLGLRRKLSNYRVRMVCSLVAMGFATWLILVWSSWGPSATFGRQFIGALGLCGYVASLFAGTLSAADAISQEKRESTLDLLLLTGLGTGDIVLGKLGARLLFTAYALLALTPTLAVSVLIGGTDAGECFRLFLVWINALVVSLSVSLLVSALCREQRAAHAAAAAATVLLAAVLPLLADGLARGTGYGWPRALLLMVSPSGPLYFSNTYTNHSAAFWATLVSNQALAWAAIVLARLALVRHQHGLSLSPGVDQRMDRSPARASRAQAAQRRLREHLLEARPIEWLASRGAGGSFWAWFWPLLAIVLVSGSTLDPQGGGRGQLGLLLFFVLQLAFKLSVAVCATYAFATDRRSGALESLLGSKLEVDEIASGTYRGLGQRLAKPALLFVGAGGLASLHLFWNGALSGALVVAVASLMLLVDSYAIFWVGLFEGLAARTPAVGLLGSILRIVVLPPIWVLAALQIFPNNTQAELAILWAVVTALNHAIFVANAKGRLYRYFRVLALKPFGEKPPPIESNWSPINWDAENPDAEPANQS